jgi:hypothetical protein
VTVLVLLVILMTLSDIGFNYEIVKKKVRK